MAAIEALLKAATKCFIFGSIEEEGGWCLYVQCGYCDAHMAELFYKNDAERQGAARKMAINWNLRKVIYPAQEKKERRKFYYLAVQDITKDQGCILTKTQRVYQLEPRLFGKTVCG